MSDDGRLPPSWGPAPGPTPDPGLAGLFPPPADPTDPYAQPGAGPTDPAVLAAQYQAELEAAPRSTGAHRARRQPARYIVPVLIAVLGIVALGLGIYGWIGSGNDSPAVGSPGGASNASSPTGASTTPTPTPTPTPTATPSARPTPTPTATATHASKPPPVAPPVVHAPSVVLNETPIRGLAAQVAARLRAKGWTVTGVGNWRGNVGTTTVYYPPGMEAAARSLAYDLGISRLRPRVAGMLTDRLTVVLTADPYA